MKNRFLGLSSAGTLTYAATPGELTSPFQLGDDGTMIVTGSGTPQGYLYITDDGFLGIGDNPSRPVVQFASGEGHSLFLLSDGTVYSCGWNQYGQLGRAVPSGSQTTINLGRIEGLSGVTSISAGPYHSLFVLADGTVHSCGENDYGQLGRVVGSGNATSVNLGQIAGLSGVASIAGGAQHSLFLLSDGTVHSCGENSFGQLGRAGLGGDTIGKIDGLAGVTSIAAGDLHSLFLVSDGTVYSCGENGGGPLGRAVADGTPTTTNLGQIEDISDVTSISAGSYHSLFLLSDGTVYSCGSNIYGQLGRAVNDGSEDAVNLGRIEGLSGVTSIAGGFRHSLFLLSDGTVYSCGWNQYGSLGRAIASGSVTRVNLGRIEGLSGVSSITASIYTSLFGLPDGTVYSCGWNQFGALGREVANGSQTFVNLGEIEILSRINDSL